MSEYNSAYTGAQIDEAVRKSLAAGDMNASIYDPQGKAQDVFAYADNAVDGVKVGGSNLILDSGRERASTDYLLTKYTPTSPLVEGEEYTVSACVTPASDVERIEVYSSNGSACLARLYMDGTEKQIVSATFTMSYAEGCRPADGDIYALLNLYRLPYVAVAETATTLHWFKVEKGNMATDWSICPQEVSTAVENAENALSVANEAEAAASVVSDNLANNYTPKMFLDTRDANETPLWYCENYPRQAITEFKNVSAIGLSGESFCTLQTFVPWVDSSGGYPRQTAKVGDKEYWRVGTADEAWSDWRDVAGEVESKADADHTHSEYLPLAGGTMTGALSHSADLKLQPAAGIIRFGTSSDINQIAVLAGTGSTYFFRPGLSNKSDLGTSTVKWKNLYLSGVLSDGTNSIAVANIASKSDIPTDTNTTYSLTKSGSTITLTGSDGSTTSVTDADTNTTYSAATTSAAGLMSASDKSKLDGITASADSVSFSRSLSSGTKIGTLTINGTGIDLYCQTNTDTNTTYSAGTGISLSGTTFSNAGVRSIATGSSNGTISVNTNGTSADVAVKGLGSAAYTASTAYAASSHSHSEYATKDELNAAIIGAIEGSY